MAKPLEFVFNNELKCRDGFVWTSFMRSEALPVQGLVAWRVQNLENHYMGGYDPKTSLYSVFVVVGGQAKLLRSVKIECRTASSNIIEVQFAGPVISIHRNGERFLLFTDSTINAPGYVGWVSNAGHKSPLVRFARLKTVEGAYVPTVVTKVVQDVARSPWPPVLAGAFAGVTAASIAKMVAPWAAEEPKVEEQHTGIFSRLDQVYEEYASTFDKAIESITEESEEEEEEEVEEEEEEEEEIEDAEDVEPDGEVVVEEDDVEDEEAADEEEEDEEDDDRDEESDAEDDDSEKDLDDDGADDADADDEKDDEEESDEEEEDKGDEDEAGGGGGGRRGRGRGRGRSRDE